MSQQLPHGLLDDSMKSLHLSSRANSQSKVHSAQQYGAKRKVESMENVIFIGLDLLFHSSILIKPTKNFVFGVTVDMSAASVTAKLSSSSSMNGIGGNVAGVRIGGVV